MRECACGFTCGTDSALARHLAREYTPQCQEVPGARDDPRDELPADPSVRLRAVAASGDSTQLLQLLVDGARLQNVAPIEAGVRAGHVAVTSALIRHTRSTRYRRPLDAVNVVANTLNWIASGYCGTAGPAMVAMLVRDRHIDVLRKSALHSWNRLALLLGKGGSAASDDDDPFTDAGRAAVAAAQRAAVPPGLHATWESAKARRPGAAKIAANETVAEQVQTAECSETALPLGCCNGCPLTHRFDRLETQVHLIACDMDRRGWAPLHHKHYPHRFRAVVQTLLLGTKCPASALSLLSDDVVHHLVAKLALRWYWELT